MLFGTAASYTAGVRKPADTLDNDADDEEDGNDDESDVPGKKPLSGALSVVELAAKASMGYPRQLKSLASFIKQPNSPSPSDSSFFLATTLGMSHPP